MKTIQLKTNIHSYLSKDYMEIHVDNYEYYPNNLKLNFKVYTEYMAVCDYLDANNVRYKCIGNSIILNDIIHSEKNKFRQLK